MAQISFTRGKSWFAGEFTYRGKRRTPASAPVGVRSIGAILMLVALGQPAAALPQIGPTSSTSVGISLSVAPKYGLRANETGIRALEDGASGFCMTTNGQPIDLPVHLVRQTANESAAGRMFKETAAQLHWCAADGWAIESIDRGDHGEEAALLMVRPE